MFFLDRFWRPCLFVISFDAGKEISFLLKRKVSIGYKYTAYAISKNLAYLHSHWFHVKSHAKD